MSTATLEPQAAPSRPIEVNYRASGSLRFGSYTHETVLPRWVVEQSGQTAEKLVRSGILEETHDPVIADFEPPRSKSAIDPMPAIAEENANLRRDNELLRQENKTLRGANDALRAETAAQKVALADATTQSAHWRQQAEASRAAAVEAEKRVKDLEAELLLERATQPDAKAGSTSKPTK
jgi:hypothetical protein